MKHSPWWLSVCLPSLISAAALAAPGDLRDELAALAAGNGFAIEGLGRIGSEPASRAQGAPPERLKALLRDYNYLLIQARPGVIEKVLITSRKVGGGKKSADSAYVGTVRLGAHHQVEAAVAGPNAVAKHLALLVDTGASTLVLPSSMIHELGFAPEDLRDGLSQTASGTEPVKIGTLGSVRIGAVSADNVAVSFIADKKLQGTMLLGMSFLQRFRMTIDDAKNELILLAK
ncbi:retropepsin-like aspartic protease family protein [Methylomagnum sp.]